MRKHGARLRITLFGGFDARLDPARPLTLPAGKVQALLTYLALAPGQAHPRDTLAALLWSDSPAEKARSSLRQTLFEVRRALGPAKAAVLHVEEETITVNASAVETDVATFEGLVAQDAPAALQEAARLYRGDLLEGIRLAESAFEDWLVSQRERLREKALEALGRLLAHQRQADPDAAIQTALRLLALDPLQEAVHCVLMRLYLAAGRRGAALRQYQGCVEALRRELGVEPEDDTKALYREIVRAAATPSTTSAGAPKCAPARPRPEAALVGRERELATLRQALEEARGGRGRVVLLIGEAGIGKSRLLEELGGEAHERGARVFIGRCHESEQILPLEPWVEAIREGGVLEGGRSLEGLAPAWRPELAHLFPELLDARLPVAAAPRDHRHLFEALARLLRHLSLPQSLLVVLEDIHWADAMSLRFLAFLGHRLQAARLVVAVSVRDEELADSPMLRRTLDELAAEQQLTRLTLARLERDHTMALVGLLGRAGSRAVAVAELGEQVWTASAGNPFIVVETMRAIGQGVTVAAPGGLPVPARVRDMMGRRLERLTVPARQLLSVAAVIGREFDFALLQRAGELGEREAAYGLEELVRRRVVHGIGDRFDLTHDLIREVAAAELLPPRRRHLHARVASALETLAGDELSRHYAALGTHYREGEVWDKAVVFLKEAALQATERCAYRDAVALLEQALAAVAYLPESRWSLEQAIEIRFDLRNALLPLGDLTTIAARLLEARALARRLDDGRRQVRAAAFLMDQLRLVGEHAAALEEGQQALGLAEPLDDLGLLILTRTRLGQVHHARGEYRQAGTLFRQNIEALTGPLATERFGLLQSPAVHSRTWLVSSLAELGAFGEARAVAEECLAIARQIGQPVALSFAWAGIGALALQQGELSRGLEALEQAVELTRPWSIPLWFPWMPGGLGYGYALSGQPDRGAVILNRALEHAVAIGIRGSRSLLLAWLAEARLLEGRGREALEAAEQALTLSGRQGERGHAARALRVRAEIEARCQEKELEAAQTTYRRALALAAELGMRPLVAHCHLGLGLLCKLSRPDHARAELRAAGELFRSMDMPSWSARAESARVS